MGYRGPSDQTLMKANLLHTAILLSALSAGSLQADIVYLRDGKSIEGKMSDVFDLRAAFAPSILGRKFCIETLGMSESDYGDPFFDTLGFICDGKTTASI